MSDAEIKIDDYELTNCIATGNTTQIWEVRQAGNKQQFAMKLLLDEAFKIPEEKKLLKQEFNLAKSFEHPNIISMIALQVTRKHGYFIMEYFRAPNLKSTIRNDRPGAQARAKRMMECLTQALSTVHRKGWLHRDIKPENILVNKGGEVRLIDFSLSSKPSNAIARALTKKSNIVIQGTRTYLAPELIKREALTTAADIYSLGIVLFETLVGHPPFRHGNPNELLMMHVRDPVPPPLEFNDNITPDLNDLVLRMLAKKPKDRPKSMDEIFAALNSLSFFKQDPIEYHKEKAEAERTSNAQVEEDRLNSRLDAERTASGYVPPPKPKKKPVAVPKDLLKPKKPTTPAPPSPAPTAQPQPGSPMPGYPGMPMPGYPMPGMPMQPGMPMPGYPYPGMPFQPGMPMQPGMNYPMPPQGYPQPGMPQPGQPQPGQPPMPGPPQTPQPPTAAAPQPAAPPQSPTGAAPPAQPTPQKPVDQPPAKPPEDVPLATLDDLEIEFE